MSAVEFHPKYINRLAAVYLEKFHKFGYDAALLWYQGFVPEEIQGSVRDVIKLKVEEEQKGGSTK